MKDFNKYFIVGTNSDALQDTMNGMVVGELIRCRDCKHMRTDRGNVFCETLEDMFYHYEYEQPINEDFDCAWAEPKEVADE